MGKASLLLCLMAIKPTKPEQIPKIKLGDWGGRH
ncbi:MAG: hypothetical protein ACI9GW_002887, partial [Halieaceae bacterium]